MPFSESPQDATDAGPPGSEQLRSALMDFLETRKASAQLPKLLALLNPIHLRAGALAGKYKTPAWSDDNTAPPNLRAHWRAQACDLLKCKEDILPDAVTAALRTFLWPAALDTTRADHLAWMVRVPAFVTKSWKAAAEALHRADSLGLDDDGVDAVMNGENDEDGKEEEDKELLGAMRIAADPFAPPEKRQRHFLELDKSLAEQHRVPRLYDMQTTPDEQPIHVFSDVRENTAAAAAQRRRRPRARARGVPADGGEGTRREITSSRGKSRRSSTCDPRTCRTKCTAR